MASPHHEWQNPASGTSRHGGEHDRKSLRASPSPRVASASVSTGSPRGRNSNAGRGHMHQRNPLRRAVEFLSPPIFALPIFAFALAAITIYFLSSRLDPTPNSVHSTSPDLLSVETSTIISQVPSNAKLTRKMASSAEQTFIAIKPDGVQRGLVGPIISRFENRGYKLAAIKLVTPPKEHLEAHYADLKGKPFFDGLIQYMLSGPICAMVWEGRDAVKTGRAILGATNPLASAPGTIRGDFAIDVGRNVCHGSDSVENAKKEIALWFKEGDVVSYKQSQFDWVYEKA
ncbi:nucleoside diphosphate kinase A [Metarhizium rileyi]|uniref:Nucleoside diphosphate kinase n=1 Tax=Metarhizium rileyi (strain RCEF 4871) TaxID=1649241 RepID=A0A167CXP5_METRR|nr:nucleoside diphosphate kinase A [Metarhizium rileyi RCEF 4871]